MADNRMRQEVREAIEAGEQALASLQAASRQLNGARNWGIADLLGGGFFTDMVKHSKCRMPQLIWRMQKVSSLFSRENLGMSRFPLTCAWTSAHF